MIRQKAILFKLNQIKFTDMQLLVSMKPSYKVCPSCQAKKCCSPHDTYDRDLISIVNGTRKDDRITIERVMCSSCKGTHALLPDILIPLRSYSLRFILYVLKAYLIRKITVVALCESFCIAVSTLYQWIHLFILHTNLLYSAEKQISKLTQTALCFIDDSDSIPEKFSSTYQFSFLQNQKRQNAEPRPG